MSNGLKFSNSSYVASRFSENILIHGRGNIFYWGVQGQQANSIAYTIINMNLRKIYHMLNTYHIKLLN